MENFRFFFPPAHPSPILRVAEHHLVAPRLEVVGHVVRPGGGQGQPLTSDARQGRGGEEAGERRGGEGRAGEGREGRGGEGREGRAGEGRGGEERKRWGFKREGDTLKQPQPNSTFIVSSRPSKLERPLIARGPALEWSTHVRRVAHYHG